MLNATESADVALRFGVAVEQVRRDHLISHLLAALSAHIGPRVLFFGGTALARAFLPAGRLSEDIDLMAVGERHSVLPDVASVLARAARRDIGVLSWGPALSSIRDTDSGVLRTADGLSVRVQLLGSPGYAPWPAEERDLEQRYADAPPARLLVPTLAAFVAWKTVAWMDRAAARDLYDLWLLARARAITPEATNLFVIHGPTRRPPSTWLFQRAPAPDQWRRELAGQTRLTVGPDEALAIVREAWQDAISGQGKGQG